MRPDPRARRLPRWSRASPVVMVLILMAGLTEVAARAVDARTPVWGDELRETYRTRRAWRRGVSWPQQRGGCFYLPYVLDPEDSEGHEVGSRGGPISAVKPESTCPVLRRGGSTTWNGHPLHLKQE